MADLRQILVSTAAYAAIWGDRQPGEESEDAILRRKFGVREPAANVQSSASSQSNGKIGFRDPRFSLELPEGFEVFRTYRGKVYRARASNGQWLLENNGKSYPSFNQLSTAIGTKTENAWRNWYYAGPDGKRHLIEALRK